MIEKVDKEKSVLGFLIEKYEISDEQKKKLFSNVTIEEFPSIIESDNIEKDIQNGIEDDIEKSIENENENEVS